jgi:lipoate-protein ligase A
MSDSLIGKAAEKVHGGKLVKAEVDFAHSVNYVKITGDFFLHPEESIEKIEKCMRGMDSDLTHDRVADMIKRTVESHGIILFGVTEDAMARVVKKAMERKEA